MDSYAPVEHYCYECKRTVPFVFGKKGLCSSCHKKYYGNTRTLTEMEEELLRKEDDIANLQTIINLMNDMQKKIKTHNQMIEAKD